MRIRFPTGWFGSFAEINDTPKGAVRAAPIEDEADLAIRQYGVLMSSDLANRKKVVSPFARFATFDRYRRMETKNPSKSPVGKRAKNTFLGELRSDPEFRHDLKRIGLIALVALLSDAALFWLAGTRLANDANTYEFILFASFAATLVIISAALAIVLRVVDEFLYFLISRIDERQG
jgi:hypothetical protein